MPTKLPKEIAEEYRFKPYLLFFPKDRSLPDYEEADNYPGFCDEMADRDDYDEAALEYMGIEEDGVRRFGDCGNLYFYIKKDDLAAQRFDKVWFVLQCG